MDRIIDKSYIKYFIPHEIGSFCPIKLYEMNYSTDTIASILSLSKEEARRLVLYKDSLLSKISKEFGKPLTKEHMDKYFTWSEGDEGPSLVDIILEWK
ncbi:MAG: hypothetical protein GX323_03730 [Clostridiales bacterium]|nr:hypothetical protein [Clostridiales bacterium]